MALQFTGNRNAKMSSVVAIDWDHVVDRPGLVQYDMDQGLDVSERGQARENIAAVGYDVQTLTPEQQEQARENIDSQRHSITDVLDNGAVGDGVTNDSPAFIAAQATGRLIFIPKGDYNLASQVTTTGSAWLPDPSMTLADMGGANLNMGRGFYTTPDPVMSSPNGANIWRFADRVFVGAVAWQMAGNAISGDSGTSWIFTPGNQPGAPLGAYLFRDGTLNVDSPIGAVAIAAASRSSNNLTNPELASIAFGGNIVNDKLNANAWGMILETVHEQSGGVTHAIETDSKNMGPNRTDTPYVNQGGALGLWVAGGGHDFGVFPPPLNPSNTAITILGHNKPWNKGIIFKNNSVTLDPVTSQANAIEMPAGYAMNWYTADGQIGTRFNGTVSDYANRVNLVLSNNSMYLFGASGTIFLARAPNTAVNYVDLLAAAPGGSPTISADGADTNIPLTLAGKGNRGVIGTFDNTGLRVYDSNSSHYLTIATTSNLTANRQLTIVPSDADRTLTLSGNLTVSATATISSFGASLTGASTARAAAANLSVPFTVRSFVPASRVSTNTAGDATEAVLATYTLPAGALGPNGSVKIWSYWNTTGGTASKTYRTRWNGLAGTSVRAAVVTTTGSARQLGIVGNRNSASSQFISNNAAGGGGWNDSTQNATAAVDTSAAVDIVFTTAWAAATAGETIVLEGYEIEINYGA